MFNLFKSKAEKETVYVQELNPEKSRQLFYVDISKDTVASKATEQGIAITDSELDWIKGLLFNGAVKTVDIFIQNQLFIYYNEVAMEVIGAFGGDPFIGKIKGYKKVLKGVELTLPINKSRAETVLITRYDGRYTMIFTGESVNIPLKELTIKEVVNAFTIITGIEAATAQSDIPEAA
jgi:hypothetical protein